MEEEMVGGSSYGWTQDSQDSEDTWRSNPERQEFGPAAFEKLHKFRSTTMLSNVASGLLGIYAILVMVSTFIDSATLGTVVLPVLILVSELPFLYWLYRSTLNIQSFNPYGYDGEGKSIVWQALWNNFKLLEDIWNTSDPDVDVSISKNWQEQEVSALRNHVLIAFLMWVFGIIILPLVGFSAVYFWRLFGIPALMFGQIYWINQITRRQINKYNSLLEKQIT